MSRRAGRGRPCDLDAGGAYSIAWKAPARLKRVVVVSGARTVASWAAKTLRLRPPAVVRSRLARGTVMLAPKDVVRVTDGAAGATSIVLARGVRAPKVGVPLVPRRLARGAARSTGLVTAVSRGADGTTTVGTRPATLQDAYSLFEFTVGDTLGDLLGAQVRASRAAALKPRITCSAPSPVDVTVDLSAVRVQLHVNASLSNPGLSVCRGRPSEGLPEHWPPERGRLPGTWEGKSLRLPAALFLTLGASFSFASQGALSAHFTWSPFIGFTYVRSQRAGNYESHMC
jgi:hypothetical protein